MIIQLNEVPKEGKTYHVDQSTGELNEALADIIGDHNYTTEFRILPVGQAFDVAGRVETKLTETCSFCAREFELLVQEKFHELLVKDETRKMTDIRDVSTETDMGVTIIDHSMKYDIGELLHEIIALAEPFQPICQSDCKGLCGGCGANLNEESCRCAPEERGKKSAESSPFSVLKKLKLN